MCWSAHRGKLTLRVQYVLNNYKGKDGLEHFGKAINIVKKLSSHKKVHTPSKSVQYENKNWCLLHILGVRGGGNSDCHIEPESE